MCVDQQIAERKKEIKEIHTRQWTFSIFPSIKLAQAHVHALSSHREIMLHFVCRDRNWFAPFNHHFQFCWVAIEYRVPNEHDTRQKENASRTNGHIENPNPIIKTVSMHFMLHRINTTTAICSIGNLWLRRLFYNLFLIQLQWFRFFFLH